MKGESRQFAGHFQQACELMENTFGIRVVQVPDKSAIQYILVSAIDPTPLPMDKPAEHDLVNGLLVPVLAVIFMNEGEVKEGSSAFSIVFTSSESDSSSF